MRFILALDAGTSRCRATLFDERGTRAGWGEAPLSITLPRPGWVEQDPKEIVAAQGKALAKALRGLPRRSRIVAAAIANQRSTILAWERSSGRPLSPAISWQDRRGDPLCRRLLPHADEIRRRTGLRLSPHYSASKIAWLLNRNPNLRRRARKGEIVFGTVNSWLIARLSGGGEPVTDETNAARTLLYNIQKRKWDGWLLDIFEIPLQSLPQVLPTECSDPPFGLLSLSPGERTPIWVSIGDQQAALAGMGCRKGGRIAINYGTGAFVLAHTGRRKTRVEGLLCSIARSDEKETEWALEGTVNSAGAALRWLIAAGLLRSEREIDRMGQAGAQRAGASGSPLFIPAFAGLAAPHWIDTGGAALIGIGREDRREEIVRAVLEGIAHRVADILERMDRKIPIGPIVAAGGLSKSGILLQIQADLLGRPLKSLSLSEATSAGAAYLAGRAAGLWGKGGLPPTVTKHYRPRISRDLRLRLRERWRKAIRALTDSFR